MNESLRDVTRRPRWGTYSTRGHLDKAALAIDLLLYDKLIFPTPREDAIDDWEKNGWQPEVQTALLDQLGDELSYRATWEGELQDRFRMHHAEAERALSGISNLENIGAEIAYPETAMLLAAAAAEDPMFVANEPVPPIAIAAFQTEAEARAAYLLRRADKAALEDDVRTDHERAFTALFTRELAIPELGAIEIDEAFGRVVELVKTAEYRNARRALYDWEQAVVAERWPIDAAQRKLVELSKEHDALVEQSFEGCWTRRVLCVATVVLPPAAGLAAGPVGFLASMAASGLLAYATAKAPKIKDPYAQPGAALGMAMNAVWKV